MIFFTGYYINQKSFHLMILRLFALFVALFVLTKQQCNATLLQFLNEYSLGRQDQLNRTFIKIGERVPTLNQVSYQNSGISYRLFNIKPKFFYIDSNQRAYISVNTNLISVVNGTLSVEYTFDWSKSSGTGGSGIAYAKSDSIGFVKQIMLNSTYAFEELFDYEPVRFFNTKTNITRISPASIPDTDFNNLELMFNSIDNVRTVRIELEEEIQKVYSYYLNMSLYEEKRIIDSFFEYQWKGPSSSVSIEYEITMQNITLERQGIRALYMEKIVNDTEWKCEHDVPTLHLNPKVYGSQQFMTFDVYKNTLRYAIERGALNTDLSRKNWESRFFQFYAGDLYEVIPKLTELYYAADSVMGSCRPSIDGLDIIKGNHDSLNVTMNVACELGIGRQKIAGFKVKLGLEVQGIAYSKNVSFVVRDFNSTVQYESNSKFVIADKSLADHMVMHSLNRLKNTQVFGSGWPTYTKDYPHFIVQENYTIIYDSTHVDPDQLVEMED